MKSPSLDRRSGLLMHVTSLPSEEGIGTLGRQAYAWIDRLAASGQRLWQILPLGPTGYGNSPYQCYSAFAGNPLLIDLRTLTSYGWLTPSEVSAERNCDEKRVDFSRVRQVKGQALRLAYRAFRQRAEDEWKSRFNAFELSQVFWLEDYALFMALHERYGASSWQEWPAELKHREVQAMENARRELFDEIEYRKFEQFLFFTQWKELHAYAEKRGIAIVGDLPIYVSYDSSDCWAHPELFALDDALRPRFVAGVPPDYFSRTGQLWGNPLYNWERLAATGYSWWIERMRQSFALYDIVRLDHFRGFEAYWSIPADAKTAAEGEWRPGPGASLFEALRKALGDLPLIAEDLGLITPGVEELRDRFDLPGMKVLQFAFDGNADNPYLPHNHRPRSVLYTGTHDNDTLMGWFHSLGDRCYVLDYLGSDENSFRWDLLRLQQMSVSSMAILPLQDLLGLGSEARMNVPGTVEGNWAWRCSQEEMEGAQEAFGKLKRLSALYGRT
ncbi:4-alpha-glucanotransferase [Nitratifractor sp.]